MTVTVNGRAQEADSGETVESLLDRLGLAARYALVERNGEPALLKTVRDEGEKAVVERVYVIHVEAFDWNCPQHITPRFTADEIRTVLAPFEERFQALEDENARLRAQVAAGNNSR